jgi:hypothetical protein
MKRSSRNLRIWAFATAISLGFAQVALAAFTCPVAAPAMAQVMSAEDCHEADPGTKHLCVKTCQDEPQKSEAPVFAALPPSTEGGLRIEMRQLQAANDRIAVDATLERATAPPPAILFSRFLK